MKSLSLQITRAESFPSRTAAIQALSALADVLVHSCLRGGLWVSIGGVRFPFMAGTLEDNFEGAAGIRADLPTHPTHVFPVFAAASGPCELGTVAVAVRPPASSGTFPGLSLVLDLTDGLFDMEPSALLELLSGSAVAIDSTSAVIGPRKWIQRDGIAWALVPRGVHPDVAGVRSAMRHGVRTIVTHLESPDSDSASAHEAATRAIAALGSHVAVPALHHASVQAVSPPASDLLTARERGAAQVPSFMAARAPTPMPVSAGAIRSLPEPVAPPAPALPSASNASDAGAAPVARLAGMTAEVDVTAILRDPLVFGPPRERGPLSEAPSDLPMVVPERSSPPPRPRLPGETTDVDIAAIARSVLAFGPSKQPGVTSRTIDSAVASDRRDAPAAEMPTGVPSFTLDQYAQLCAEVAMVASPAARSAVLRRYSVANPEALTAAWRARFSADPALAGRWSAAYAHHYARLRGER